MLSIRRFTLLIAGTLLIASVTQGKLRKWNQKMQELAKTFAEMVPELSDSRLPSAQSRAKLEKNAKKLLALAHTVNMGPDTPGNPLPPDMDPTIGFVSSMFERQTKRAYESLKAGRIEYGKATLRNISGHCIACHTRHDRGPEFPTLDLSAQIESLPPMDRAEFLSATRQFDAALDEFEKIAANAALAKTKQWEWAKAVRHGLTLIVRVKKDPDRALSFLHRVVAIKQIPLFYREDIVAWNESVKQWKAEAPRKATSEEGLFIEAVRLNEAARAKQKFPLDSSGDVFFLRSSALAHEMLSLYPDGKRTTEALLLLGQAYELLDERMISPLPLMFYEACIRRSPHSPEARQCYRRYEQNTFFAWSGTSGTHIPKDVQKDMEELEKLSEIKE